MAEWLKAAVLKTVEPQGSVGSNPTSSAIFWGILVVAMVAAIAVFSLFAFPFSACAAADSASAAAAGAASGASDAPAQGVLTREMLEGIAWDYKVRVLYTVMAGLIGVASLVVVVFVSDALRARRILGAIATTSFIVTLFGHMFFREPVSTAILCVVATLVALAALAVAYKAEAIRLELPQGPLEGDAQDE